MRSNKILIALGFFIILMTACSQTQETTVDFPPGTMGTKTASQIKTEIEIDTPISRTIFMPTSTFTPRTRETSTPTRTPENTGTYTPASRPTLPPEATISQLTELIQNNGNCRLPCWWGITPNQSKIDEYYAFLVPFATIADFHNGGITQFDNQLESYVTRINFGHEITTSLGVNIYTRASQDTIEMLHIYTRVYQKTADGYSYIYGNSTYNRLFKAYLLPQILTDYGPPDEVLLRLEYYLYDGSPPSANQPFGALHLILLYLEKGVYVFYEMPLKKVDDYGEACPSEGFISLWLTPPDSEEQYIKIVSAAEDQGKLFDYGKNIEAGTNMTLERFYSTFKESTQTCIRTPLSIWPDPYENPPY